MIAGDIITVRRRVDPKLQLDLMVDIEPNGCLRELRVTMPGLDNAHAAIRAGLKADLDRLLVNLVTLMANGDLARDIIGSLPVSQRPFVEAIADAQDFVLARDTSLARFFSGKAA